MKVVLSKNCPIITCRQPCETEGDFPVPMCGEHWSLVPLKLRESMHRVFSMGNWNAYRVSKAAAIRLVNELEQKGHGRRL